MSDNSGAPDSLNLVQTFFTEGHIPTVPSMIPVVLLLLVIRGRFTHFECVIEPRARAGDLFLRMTFPMSLLVSRGLLSEWLALANRLQSCGAFAFDYRRDMVHFDAWLVMDADSVSARNFGRWFQECRDTADGFFLSLCWMIFYQMPPQKAIDSLPMWPLDSYLYGSR